MGKRMAALSVFQTYLIVKITWNHCWNARFQAPVRFSGVDPDLGICALGQSPLWGIRFGKHCFIQCGQKATLSARSTTHQGPHSLVDLGFPSCWTFVLPLDSLQQCSRRSLPSSHSHFMREDRNNLAFHCNEWVKCSWCEIHIFKLLMESINELPHAWCYGKRHTLAGMDSGCQDLVGLWH